MKNRLEQQGYKQLISKSARTIMLLIIAVTAVYVQAQSEAAVDSVIIEASSSKAEVANSKRSSVIDDMMPVSDEYGMSSKTEPASLPAPERPSQIAPTIGAANSTGAPKIFKPSEQVSEDLSVSFPADI